VLYLVVNSEACLPSQDEETLKSKVWRFYVFLKVGTKVELWPRLIPGRYLRHFTATTINQLYDC
jgi:hypothetical protein